MSERNPSRTAMGTAYMRAAHQLLEASPRVLEDPLAVRLLGVEAEQRIRAAPDYFQSAEQRALRATVVLRSRVAEDRLRESLVRGVTQYVLLGAGFDTFALRQPKWAHGLRIVEVDHEGTQNSKRALIAAADIAVPKNLTFATIDFENESLRDGLLRNAVDLQQPTFFAWLGVTMYLHESAIDATLQGIASFPIGSEVVLTYAPPHSVYKSPFEGRAADLGEPWLSFFTPQAIAEKLRSFGLGKVEFQTAATAQERYFKDRPQDLSVPRATNIVAAIRE